jgi:hypothetical protein
VEIKSYLLDENCDTNFKSLNKHFDNCTYIQQLGLRVWMDDCAQGARITTIIPGAFTLEDLVLRCTSCSRRWHCRHCCDATQWALCSQQTFGIGTSLSISYYQILLLKSILCFLNLSAVTLEQVFIHEIICGQLWNI